MNNKDIGDETVLEHTNKRELTNGQMNRIWWVGMLSGIFSALCTWDCYKKFEGYLNNVPTLLTLIMLTGLFLLMSYSFKNVTFYHYDRICANYQIVS